MSHKHKSELHFQKLNGYFFELEGAERPETVPIFGLQNDRSIRALPEVPIGLDLTEINLFNMTNVDKIVTDKDESEHWIVGKSGPDLRRATLSRYRDLCTYQHEPYIVWIDRPQMKPKVLLYWKKRNKTLLVSLLVLIMGQWLVGRVIKFESKGQRFESHLVDKSREKLKTCKKWRFRNQLFKKGSQTSIMKPFFPV